MRKPLRRLRSQRGQALILFVGLLSVIMAISVIVVDFGLWFSEHRGAQKDADAAALAGAQAYLADLSDTNTAFGDGVDWAIKNGVDSAKIDPSPTSNCSDGNSCIDVGTGNCREDGTDTSMPWVEARVRHNSRALFGGIFGLVAPDIGAIARACVGSPRSGIEFTPFGIQTDLVAAVGTPESGEDCYNEKDDDHDKVVNDGCGPLSDCLKEDPAKPGHTIPVYGSACVLRTEGGAGVSGQNGFLSIGEEDCWDTSASSLKHDLEYGSDATCTIGNDVNSATGEKGGMIAALNDRLTWEGLCDSRFHTGNTGHDDFDEVFSLVGATPGQPIVPAAGAIFSENDCRVPKTDSDGKTYALNPRVINLLLVDEYKSGEKTAKIVGFAAFYVIGCYNHADAPAIEAALNVDLRNMSTYMNQCPKAGGQDVVLGVFVQKLAPPINVGNPDESLPLSIVLVK